MSLVTTVSSHCDRTGTRWPFASFRALICLVVVLVAFPSAAADAVPACWQPPVPGTVIDPFRPPPCPWCPGNRGIEYATALGSPVRAVATGVVTFSGVVAGVRYVVVDVGAGRRVTYGRLTASSLRRGDRVVVGGRIGSSGGALFFGLRVNGEYRDPAPLLGVPVGRPRLVPTDGSPARPAPPPRLRCARSPRRVGRC